MPKITSDLDGVLDLEAKKKILHEIKQDDLIDLFKKNFKTPYAPLKQKKSALDQSIAIAITTDEKDILTNELKAIKKQGGRVTLSSVMRHRVLVDIDLIEWKEQAIKGLKELNGPNWNKSTIIRNRNKYTKTLDDLPLDDDESRLLFISKINECNRQLLMLEKPKIKRSYRLRGRLTFTEANLIRWRAARLNLSIADYMRFLIFGYVPFSDNDKTLSVESRKRFYISVLDVAVNGWGNPPQMESCPNCVRYLAEIKELKQKIARIQNYNK